MVALSKTDFPVLGLPAGMRATRAMQALLRVLPAQQPQGGWTEGLVEVTLREQGVTVNRVTVYRALDRLVQAGALLCTVDKQRTMRYWVASHASLDTCAHWACKGCNQSVPLDANAAAVQAALHALQQAISQTAGVHSLSMDVVVQGECVSCATERCT